MCELDVKYREWRESLFGEDVHSIQKQILSMIWDAAVFQSVNEARRYAPVDEDNHPKLNSMLHGFINHSFFETQALAIRRLLDKGTRPGPRSVYSLYALVDNLEKNLALLTRKHILAALGYPYEYEKGLEAFYRPVERGEQTQDIMSCRHSSIVHDNLDVLTGVSAEERSPNDTVRKEIFSWLKVRLGRCSEIYSHVNKFVAHAATPESRASIRADDIKITLGDLFDAQRIICQTAQFIGVNLFHHSFGNFLVSCAFNQFKYLDRPCIPEEAVKELDQFWTSYAKTTEQWRNWDWIGEFNEAQ